MGKPRVGVIGLGSMGGGVAKSLLRNGFPVTVCDVRPAVVESFVAQGAKGTASPAGLAADCAILVVLVVNAEQVESVLFGEGGAVAAMKPGTTVIMSVTLPPDYAEKLAVRLGERGILMLDAPVSGGEAKAATGEMTVMASGSPEAFAKCEAVLSAIAQKVYRLGDAAGTGSKVKMINQLLAGVHIAASAEAMALGIKAGADPNVLYEVISNSAGSSWMFQNRVPHILDGDYAPRSAVNIFVKDLGIVLEAGKGHKFPLPLTAAAHQMFLMAAAAGHGAEDDAAVVKIFPGIELPKAK
ncbi:MAG: NAD(P)-dependent oxidoreductase [Hyphomicrobiales bacterium]|nr:MAG: NAD(P)-dependent oxidoreductase [Hyphomicrobiales bacterium]